MARFKKKKSAPTKGRDEPKKEAPEEGIEPAEGPGEGPTRAPPAEDRAPATEDASKDESISAAQQNEKDSKLNRLFWMRVVFAIAAGVTATFLFDSVEGEERRWASIGFMIIVFIATIVIGKTMRIPFALSDRKKIVTQGIGSYIFVYLFMWVLSYTLVNVGSVESAMPFP